MVLAAVLALGACGTDERETKAPTTDAETTIGGDVANEQEALFPDVLEVEVTPVGDGRYEVAVTLSSPYDTPERYADAWRVLDEEGNELGRRELAHDHAAEQPFTRQTTVEIPDEVDEITVEGRDQISGYGGATMTVTVPRDG
ncbi:MAG: hypothetical protein U5K30_09765 [Acidimicrobiales bacterium]|nr:hypothetical protein [Acidimicrobiales bacterium]